MFQFDERARQRYRLPDINNLTIGVVMKKYIQLFLLCSFSLGILLIAYLLIGYPSAWDDVQLGMTREQVHQVVGAPTHSSWPEKGDFYSQSHPLGKWELFVGPNKTNDTAHIRIWLWLGDIRYYINEDGSFYKAISQQFF